jgi:nitrate reductase NapAB chaperone NapD
MVWLESQQDIAAPAGRRLAGIAKRMAVIAYSLVRTNKLPQRNKLLEAIAAPDLTSKVAEKLAEARFISEEHAGQLVVVVAATAKHVDKIRNALQGTQSLEETAAVQQLMHVIGEHHSVGP